MGGKNVLTLPRAITFLNIWKIIAIISIIKRCHFSINLENDKVIKATDYWLVSPAFSGLTVMRVEEQDDINQTFKLGDNKTDKASSCRYISLPSCKIVWWQVSCFKFSVYIRDTMREQGRAVSVSQRWDNWQFLSFLWSVFHWETTNSLTNPQTE